MKKAILSFGLVVAALFGSTITNAQNTTAAIGGAEITFEKEVHDYGTIEQHADGKCEFSFKNTGTEPLIISNAKGSCGCTVPDWPRDPIMPGASSVITVKYDTKRPGLINKSVTITSNAVNAPTKVIRIKGNVKVPAEDATPVKPAEGPVNN